MATHVAAPSPQALLRNMFNAAIAAAQPEVCLPPFLPSGSGRLLVVGAGKASATMAKVVEDRWQGSLSGLVVTREGLESTCEKIEVVEASHPVPDPRSLIAARRLLALVAGLRCDYHVLCLMSGGASALLSLPAEGLTLEDKQAINQALLRSGADIREINCVRRHLSAIKGGRLAAACFPAKLTTLILSDVPGDFLPDIGSGPTVADPTSCKDALDIVRRYGISMPEATVALLESGRGETIKPGDERLSRAETKLIGTPRLSLLAAARVAEEAGIRPIVLGDRIEGESRDVAEVMAGIALSIAAYGEPAAPPCVLISGGETTVTVRGNGVGGRNVEFLLALAIALQGTPKIHALAGDTDGVDGAIDVAGAVIGPDTIAKALELGLSAEDFLVNNDAHSFFDLLDDAVVTGPTGTNVNDFRAVLVTDPSVRASA